MCLEQIRLAPVLDNWDNLRGAIQAFSCRHNIGTADRTSLELAAEEWFVNLVMHGCGQQDSASSRHVRDVEVSLWMDGDKQVSIRFTDAGPPFNPLEHPEPDTAMAAEDREIGGLGIYLIKKSMDHCTYRRIEDRNQFTLCKRVQATVREEGDEHGDHN